MLSVGKTNYKRIIANSPPNVSTCQPDPNFKRATSHVGECHPPQISFVYIHSYRSISHTACPKFPSLFSSLSPLSLHTPPARGRVSPAAATRGSHPCSDERGGVRCPWLSCRCILRTSDILLPSCPRVSLLSPLLYEIHAPKCCLRSLLCFCLCLSFSLPTSHCFFFFSAAGRAADPDSDCASQPIPRLLCGQCPCRVPD